MVAKRKFTKLEIGSSVSLTHLEKVVLNAMRSNEYADCLEGYTTWTFSVIDNSKLNPKVARGVLSSLVKKGLIKAYTVTPMEKLNGEEDYCCFTEKGQRLYDNADGEECKYWGGKPLLKL